MDVIALEVRGYSKYLTIKYQIAINQIEWKATEESPAMPSIILKGPSKGPGCGMAGREHSWERHWYEGHGS